MLRIKHEFTLSEVLIALTVIGVIAAITISNLYSLWLKQETLSRLKKTYSTLAQTTNLAISDNGPIATWEVESGTAASTTFANIYLIPYLNIMKNCGTNNSSECKIKAKTLKGDDASSFWENYPHFYLNDGTLIGVFSKKDTSNNQYYSYIYVDINGQRPPNIMGRDIFVFIYFIYYESAPQYNGKFFGWPQVTTRERLLNDPLYGCNKQAAYFHPNFACAALIMNDNWQIKSDYPW